MQLLHASVGLGDADEAAQLRCAAAMTLDSASLDAVYDEELSEMSGSLPLMRSFGSFTIFRSPIVQSRPKSHFRKLFVNEAQI